MTEPVRRIITGVTVGQVDATVVPRYGGEATFARLPRLQDVPRADVAIVGVPFDSGVSYRPGARFGPSHIRESSRLLRPYNPALQVPVFANQQVADAGDLAVNPFSIDEAITATRASSGASSGSGTSSRWSEFRGSLSSDATPANISCSSARTTAPR